MNTSTLKQDLKGENEDALVQKADRLAATGSQQSGALLLHPWYPISSGSKY